MNSSATDRQPPFGLLAGWGRLPIEVATALQRHGYAVHTLLIKDHADPILAEISTSHEWIGLGQLGKCVRFYQRHQVTTATMVGKVHKVRLLDRGALWNHFPDWYGARIFGPFIWGKKDRKDDTILGGICRAFSNKGIEFVPATDYAPDLLVKFGQLSGKPLSKKQLGDVQYGWDLAKAIGKFDTGQSVAIKGQMALALEAVEGTDECIRRAGQLCRSGGFTIVKVAKPQQDMRFDVPTIGVGTIETMAASGAVTLVIEADKTIIVDEPAVIALANKLGVTIVAATGDRLGEVLSDDEAAAA
ncbi:UDP-2,3-diacylglucosamine diphosphatase LpxI [Blastopirellula sp. J2-11]|uniref:LpxI family protein n=1 Tax=Blastopirellula sp. J2-11 TaxID=2943192 RepID=UPI0021C56FFC|nr:UDP-2,3-diacylglucosamine diphosphatase LpxI [Blastopirellula sp. J2-11]UUO06629.1 UDP-2,3-diacylglucosamine diphosphatase LpxI [Blastopirellula sp. J2-11]